MAIPKELMKKLLGYVSRHQVYAAQEPKKDNVNTDLALETIRHLETRGVKEPYKFSQPSGSPISGDALGAYQVTEAKLKEQSPKLFGKEISRDEFLSSPEIQDEFQRKLIDNRFVGEFNFDLPTIFAAHRGGFSNLDKMQEVRDNYKQYVDEGVGYYQNKLKSQ